MSSSIHEVDRSIKAGDWDLALQTLESLKASQPARDVFPRMAHCQAVRGKYRAVVETFLELAQAHLDAQRLEEAETALHQALTLQPESGLARERRIEVERRRGNIERAIEMSRELARLSIEQGEGERAIRLLQGAASEQPDNLDIALELAEMFVAHGHICEGARAFRQVAARFQEAGNPRRAIDAYRRLKVVQSDDCEVMLTLGRLFIALGQHEEAEKELRAVLRHDLDHEEALLHLGWVCQLTGRFRSGMLAFNKLLQNQPDHAVANRKLAELHVSLGMTAEASSHLRAAARAYLRVEQTADAVVCWRHLLSLDPGHSEAQQELTRLDASPLPLAMELPGLAISPIPATRPPMESWQDHAETTAPPVPRAEPISQSLDQPLSQDSEQPLIQSPEQPVTARPRLVRRGLVKVDFNERLALPESKESRPIRQGLVGKPLSNAPLSDKPLLPSPTNRTHGPSSPRPEPISPRSELDIEVARDPLGEDFGSELFSPRTEPAASLEPASGPAREAESVSLEDPLEGLFENCNLFEELGDSESIPPAEIEDEGDIEEEQPVSKASEEAVLVRQVPPDEDPSSPEPPEDERASLFEGTPPLLESPTPTLLDPEPVESRAAGLLDWELELEEQQATNLFDWEPELTEGQATSLIDREPELIEGLVTSLIDQKPELEEQQVTSLFDWEPELEEHQAISLFDWEPELEEQRVTSLFDWETEPAESQAESQAASLADLEPELDQFRTMSLFDSSLALQESEGLRSADEAPNESGLSQPSANDPPLDNLELEPSIERTATEPAFEFPADDHLFEAPGPSPEEEPLPLGNLLSSEERQESQEATEIDELEERLAGSDAASLIAAYRAALEDTPENFTLRTRLADLLMRYGLLDEAVVHYRLAIAQQPDAIVPLRRVIAAELWSDSYQQAAESLIALATLHLRRGEGDEALDVLQAVLTLDPLHCGGLWEMARLFAELRQDRLARHHFRQLAETALNQGDVDAALAAFRQLVDSTEPQRCETRPERAAVDYIRQLVDGGQLSEAGRAVLRLEKAGGQGALIAADVIASLRDELSHEPGLHFAYAELCYQCGLIDRAIEGFQKTRRHGELERASTVKLGLCFAAKQGYMMADLAARQFRRALELPGDDPSHELEARYNLALIELDSGRHREALGELERCVALQPDYRDSAERIRRLRQQLSR